MSRRLPPVPPGAPSSKLNATRRIAEINSSADSEVDLVVIGGGITGVGVALDAATRGLSVVLLERDDLAQGTSRWSSKLVHGGLRYLASGQVGIAWESAVERARLMEHIAPHLIHPMPQVLPLTESVSAPLVGAGLTAADVMRRFTGAQLPSPRRVDAITATSMVPGVSGGFSHAAISWDGQLIDDARLVVAVARTAAAYGARILTHSEVLHAERGRVAVSDRLTGERWELRPRRVINATGAWADTLDDRITLVRSRGTHLVVSSEKLGHPTAALAAQVPGSSTRFVFALPQPHGLTYIGLTDVVTDDPVDSPRADEEEITFLLDTMNTVLTDPLTRADVKSTYSGYRPLLAGADESSADLSRRHAVLDGDVISVVGGKLTTYRRMAEDAVDVITDRPCRTRELPLVGAAAWSANSDRLRQRFGAEASLVAQLPTNPAGLTPLGDSPVLGVEVAWALAAEGAITEDDVLERRLRLDIMPWWRTEVAAALPAHAGAPVAAEPGLLLA